MEKSLYVKTKKRTEIYYAHPYSSWERGASEQANSMVRRFVPKGTNIYKTPKEEVKRIENWLNDCPRRILGGLSINEKKSS